MYLLCIDKQKAQRVYVWVKTISTLSTSAWHEGSPAAVRQVVDEQTENLTYSYRLKYPLKQRIIYM